MEEVNINDIDEKLLELDSDNVFLTGFGVITWGQLLELIYRKIDERGVYVKNETTGEFHKLVLHDNKQGIAVPIFPKKDEE